MSCEMEDQEHTIAIVTEADGMAMSEMAMFGVGRVAREPWFVNAYLFLARGLGFGGVEVVDL